MNIICRLFGHNFLTRLEYTGARGKAPNVEKMLSNPFCSRCGLSREDITKIQINRENVNNPKD